MLVTSVWKEREKKKAGRSRDQADGVGQVTQGERSRSRSVSGLAYRMKITPDVTIVQGRGKRSQSFSFTSPAFIFYLMLNVCFVEDDLDATDSSKLCLETDSHIVKVVFILCSEEESGFSKKKKKMSGIS